jgi:hypothetical protein
MNKLKTFMDRHAEKDKEERQRLILEHPEDFYHWEDNIGVTRQVKGEPSIKNEPSSSRVKTETRIDDDLERLLAEPGHKKESKPDWDALLDRDVKNEMKIEGDSYTLGASKTDDDWGTLLGNSSGSSVKKEPRFDDWGTGDFSSSHVKKDTHGASSSTLKRERTFDDIDLAIGMNKVDFNTTITKSKGKQRVGYRPEDVDKLLTNMKAANTVKHEDDWNAHDDDDDDDIICISDTPPTLKRNFEEENESKEQKKSKYEIIEID